MLKRYLCITAVAAALLSAGEPPTSAPASPEFKKAALKALITMRNGVHRGETNMDQSRVQSAIDDAEVEASSEKEKAVLSVLKVFRIGLENIALMEQTRTTELQSQYLLARHVDPSRYTVEIADKVNADPAIIKERTTAKACGDVLEKLFRTGILSPATDCDFPKPTVK